MSGWGALYVFLVFFIVSMILGIDLAKPLDGMCESCVTEERKQMMIRTICVGLLLVTVGAFVLIENFGASVYFAILIAIAGVAGIASLGKKVGMLLRGHLWIRA